MGGDKYRLDETLEAVFWEENFYEIVEWLSVFPKSQGEFRKAVSNPLIKYDNV